MNRYVYHAPSEIAPRSVASGDQNVVGLHGLALVMNPAGDLYPSPHLVRAIPSAEVNDCAGCGPMRYDPIVPIVRLPPVYVASAGSAGATATVPQPPPTSGGTLLVANPGVLPLSPQPSPTVAAPTPLTLAQPGTTLDSSGSSTTVAPAGVSALVTDFENWLAQHTSIAGYSIPNTGIAAAIAIGLWMFSGKRGRR